jgi:Flp pilus assembly protein TadD
MSMAALLLLAACGNGGTLGQAGDVPGVDVADAALRGGSPQVALRIDDAILAKDPHNVAALLNRGAAETALQRTDAAAESYAAALRADPASVAARIGLGRLRLAVDPGSAETLFLEASQRDPRNAIALNDLGVARDLLGRHEDAQIAYRQAMGIDATMTGAQVNLALSLAMAGRAEDATPLLRPLASAPAAPRKLRHDLAAVLAMGGDRGGAQQILARDLSPDEVNQALSIFTTASAPAGAARALEAGPAAAAGNAAVGDAAVGNAPVGKDPLGNVPPGDTLPGNTAVQLSSQRSSAAAEAAWQRLRQQIPDLVADRQPILVRAENGGQVLWRLRTAGFVSSAQAEMFCRAVRARGLECSLAAS